MKKSLLGHCLRVAKDNLINHPEYTCYPHWSFVIRNNEIIGNGVNRRHEPPKLFGYHQHRDEGFVPKWHSELDAIKRTLRRKLINFEIINIRLNKSGQCRIAMPCKTCRNILNILECKKIYFTTETGWGQI